MKGQPEVSAGDLVASPSHKGWSRSRRVRKDVSGVQSSYEGASCG
jgi:hypothetical protein